MEKLKESIKYKFLFKSRKLCVFMVFDRSWFVEHIRFQITNCWKLPYQIQLRLFFRQPTALSIIHILDLTLKNILYITIAMCIAMCIQIHTKHLDVSIFFWHRILSFHLFMLVIPSRLKIRKSTNSTMWWNEYFSIEINSTFIK